ncbi:hypothetical protein ACFQ9X_36765 [Catenulispora yoronensis]
MSTHIVANKVRDFSWSAGAYHHDTVVTAAGVTVDAYWPNSESDSNCRELMRYAASALDSYGERFGAYPYPRFTIVFDEFGSAFDGMEYPNYVLASAYRGAVAHEVAHQWWFGLVGDDQYRHPWLDEAFAEYSAEQFEGGGSRPTAATGSRPTNGWTSRWTSSRRPGTRSTTTRSTTRAPACSTTSNALSAAPPWTSSCAAW